MVFFLASNIDGPYRCAAMVSEGRQGRTSYRGRRRIAAARDKLPWRVANYNYTSLYSY